MNIILASASIRRQELIQRVVKDFKVIVSNFNESEVAYDGFCEDYVMDISKGKALDVSEKINVESLVIGCDTVVTLDGAVLGKPKDREDAFNMIKKLSGRKHEVYSGITIVNTRTKEVLSDFSCTVVEFSKLNSDEILRYIDSGEPFDKAGAYGIQGYAGVFVKEIHGCYYNVVGLPLNKLKEMLKQMGVN
ncbi:MAG: Maf-like protein [Clostridium sp.]